MNRIFRNVNTSFSRIHLIEFFYLTVRMAAGSIILQSSPVAARNHPRRSIWSVAVPISDAYIVQYLLNGTSEVPTQIHWCEKDSEHFGYVARVEDVDLILEPLYSRAGSCLILRFRHDDEEFGISEPAGGGWLGRKFSSEDERQLVRLFRGLLKAVASQCNIRRQRAEQNQEQIRERISHRLLFGEPRETSTRAVIAGPR